MEEVEAAIAVYIVRFGLSLAGLVLAIVCWIRISRSERLKAELPSDTIALLAGAKHQVAELSESLTTHINKDNARAGAALRRERRDAPPVPEEPAAAAPTEAQILMGLNRAASLANAGRRGVRHG